MSRAVIVIGATVLLLGASATPPPTIYRIVTRPLCSQLHERIRPAIGMMLQNDSAIKKSPELFRKYNDAALYGGDAGTARNGLGGDPDSGSNATQNVALLGMENLIRPIANNIIAIQTMLDNPQLRVGSGRPEDDKRLHEIRDKLLKALAAQNASLDIISGFVDTQQMADLQHAGQAYISSIGASDLRHGLASTPSPNPLTSNPNYAGLPPNPYAIDPASIPGLTLGYNPVTRLLDALTWTMNQTQTRENEAAKAVMASAAMCSSNTSPKPPP
jgi:hypothetical protein